MMALAAAETGITPPVPPAGTTAAPARSPLVEKLLAEVGGNEDALIERLLGQSNGISALHRQLDEVRQLLQQKDQPAFDASADPQVKLYSDQIAAIDAEKADISTRQSALATEANEINTSVLKIQGKLEMADEFQQKELNAEIDRLRASYRGLQSEYAQLSGRAKSLDRERTSMQFQQKQAAERAQALHEESVAVSRQTAEADAVFQTQTQQTFNAAVAEQAGRYGIGDVNGFREVIRDRFIRFTDSLPEGAPAVDLSAYVAAEADKLAKVYGLTPKADFTQHSRAVAAAAVMKPVPAVPAPASSAPAPPSGFERLSLADQARLAREHGRNVLRMGKTQ